MSRAQLLPPEVVAALPPLYSQDGLGMDAVARTKFFTPWANWTWYVTEYDPEEELFFGLVDGLERELGYFSLEELLAVRGPGGLEIERDEYWTAKTLNECP